jgi:hypothetical protein
VIVRDEGRGERIKYRIEGVQGLISAWERGAENDRGVTVSTVERVAICQRKVSPRKNLRVWRVSSP